MYAVSVTLSTPEATYLPVSLTEAKLHLRVDHTSDDDLITRLIKAATEQAEEFTGLQIRNATISLNLSALPSGRDLLYLPRPKMNEITVCEYYNANENIVDLISSIITYPGDISAIEPSINANWPSIASQRSFPVSVSYSAGYQSSDDVPNAIKQAVLLQVGAMYEYREAISDKNITKIANGFYDLLMPHVIGDEFQVYNESR